MKRNFLLRLFSSFFLLIFFYFILFINNYLFAGLLFLLFFISSYEWSKLTQNLYLKLFGWIFLIFSYFTVFQVKNFNTENVYFILVVLICIGTDLGGYIFGKVLGGPKLTKISPNKTIAGFFGGLILSLIIAVIFESFIEKIVIEKTPVKLSFFIYVLLFSVISQLGDLLISFFKRKAEVDDTGNIIPGHGGLLDRIDGMIFVFPFFYFYLIST